MPRAVTPPPTALTPGEGRSSWPDNVVGLSEVVLQDPHQVRLRVTDTGVGIPPDELPRVTERFFRGEGSAAMAAGSGIGLTIVSELVRAHDGELTITSEQHKGTEVTITLPRLCPAQPDDRRPPSRTVRSDLAQVGEWPRVEAGMITQSHDWDRAASRGRAKVS